MATAAQFTVTTTPQLIGKCTDRAMTVWVHSSATMYFGGDNTVSSSTGFRLDANDKYSTTVYYGDEIWAVAGSGSQKLYTFMVVIAP